MKHLTQYLQLFFILYLLKLFIKLILIIDRFFIVFVEIIEYLATDGLA
jgi:hypothetical protein